MTIRERSRNSLAASILGAGLPLDGISATNALQFPASATAQQRTDGQAIADAWDWTDAAQLLREAQTYRDAAKALFDELKDVGRSLKAIAGLTVDEINVIRQWLTSFKAGTAGAATLAAFKTMVAALPDMPDRTDAQARTAFRNLVDAL